MQKITSSITHREFFNSPAFRQGFEDVRTASPPRFDDDWGKWQLAYEIGRLIASQGSAAPPLPQIGTKGRLSSTAFKWLKEQYREYAFGPLEDDPLTDSP
jgi:hypothetical protein